jgi:hypothetical protein
MPSGCRFSGLLLGWSAMSAGPVDNRRVGKPELSVPVGTLEIGGPEATSDDGARHRAAGSRGCCRVGRR